MPTIYRRGSKGPKVRKIQEKLTEQGYSPGLVDGVFGTKTEAAIQLFQKDNSTFADGMVGPDTWSRFFPKKTTERPLLSREEQQEIFNKFAEHLATLPERERLKLQEKFTRQHLNKLGISISQLKQWLSEIEVYEGHRDYSFDSKLTMAIINLQKDNNIQPADGIFGSSTARVLHELIKSKGPLSSDKYLSILKQGIDHWNNWRERNPHEIPVLRNIDFRDADLSQANLRNVDLTASHFFNSKLNGTDLSRATLKYTLFRGTELSVAKLIRADLTNARFPDSTLIRANLTGATLIGASMSGVYLGRATLSEAKLQGVDLSDATLHGITAEHANFTNGRLKGADLKEANLRNSIMVGTDLSEADLSGANFTDVALVKGDLNKANLVEANFEKADLSGCRIYGISAWNLKLNEKTKQTNLIITKYEEPEITVDNLEVAQFVYLILNNKNIRKVLDTITSKAVLILGRFTPERKEVLDAMAQKLRDHDLLPIIFDFERSSSRDFTETIKTLAGMSLFVIVDITNPKSSPLELQAIIPDYQIPFVPIIQEGEEPFSMFSDLMNYDWLLKPVITYKSKDILVEVMKEAMIDRAWEKHKEIEIKKTQDIEMVSADDFLKKKSTNDGE